MGKSVGSLSGDTVDSEGRLLGARVTNVLRSALEGAGFRGEGPLIPNAALFQFSPPFLSSWFFFSISFLFSHPLILLDLKFDLTLLPHWDFPAWIFLTLNFEKLTPVKGSFQLLNARFLQECQLLTAKPRQDLAQHKTVTAQSIFTWEKVQKWRDSALKISTSVEPLILLWLLRTPALKLHSK